MRYQKNIKNKYSPKKQFIINKSFNSKKLKNNN